MSSIKRKNSIWQLYGIVIIWWVLYAFLILIGKATTALIPILVLVFLSVLIILSQWSSNVEVVFFSEHFTVKHYFKIQTKQFAYTDISTVEDLYTRVLGRRLVFKCSNIENKVTEFTLYKPDKELVKFVSNHIKTYKNKMA